MVVPLPLPPVPPTTEPVLLAKPVETIQPQQPQPSEQQQQITEKPILKVSNENEKKTSVEKPVVIEKKSDSKNQNLELKQDLDKPSAVNQIVATTSKPLISSIPPLMQQKPNVELNKQSIIPPLMSVGALLPAPALLPNPPDTLMIEPVKILPNDLNTQQSSIGKY